MITSSIIRKKFFDYFKKLHHQQVASSSLIPAQDPTILFTNAGMNQFKDVLLGKETRSYKRAVTIQKCVRAGGKHNDLDNVGFTQRHLTFFEMMGNFSFGDYFKHDAIPFAWNFLTQEMQISAEKLSVSVHHSDDQAYMIWRDQIGIPEDKIFRLGADNFWQMGDVGPCGPCTEIFYDRGPAYGCGKENCNVPCGCDRFLEVWNVVFMQYEKQADGSDLPLQQTGIDTGMGLERLCVVLQNKESVFDIDLFQPCIKKIEQLTGHVYHASSGIIKAAFNVLLDHVRSTSFLIGDGCAPCNEGRGYVIRKIIRRAALFAQKLTDKNIFPQLALQFIDSMKEFYPDLLLNQDRIVSVLTMEIDRFSENLVRGKQILQGYIEQNGSSKIISGMQAFTLYDTYGFPVEVVQLVAAEQNCTVDIVGFEQQMEVQRQKSGKKMKQTEQSLTFDHTLKTIFTGYESYHETSEIIALVFNNQLVTHVKAGQACSIVTAKTPFYVACGGQVDDQGTITSRQVTDALLGLRKIDNVILMDCVAPTDLAVNDTIEMHVNQQARKATMKNHTATHLLQAALQTVLGKQVKQAGSLVTQDYLRFDYTYHQPLTAADSKKIENLINEKIWENIPVQIEHTTLQEATSRGVIAFFGDKYNPDAVRAVIVPGFSAELCGGTHVKATGDIGMFKIVEDTALAAGQRRIVAYTGPQALQLTQDNFNLIKKLEQDCKVKSEQLQDVVEKMQAKIKDLTLQIKQFKSEQCLSIVEDILAKSDDLHGIPTACIKITGFAQYVKDIAVALQAKKPGLYIIINVEHNASTCIASIAEKYSNQFALKSLQTYLQQDYGLRSGGNQLQVQGGGPVISDDDIKRIRQWIAKI